MTGCLPFCVIGCKKRRPPHDGRREGPRSLQGRCDILKFGFDLIDLRLLGLGWVIPASLLHLSEYIRLNLMLLLQDIQKIISQAGMHAFAGKGVVNAGDGFLRGQNVLHHLPVGHR